MDRKAAIATAGVTAMALASAGVVLVANIGLLGTAAGNEKKSISAKVPPASASAVTQELPPEVVTIYRDEVIPAPASPADRVPARGSSYQDGQSSASDETQPSENEEADSPEDDEDPEDGEPNSEEENESEEPETPDHPDEADD